jgi:hypothetical protein
MKGTFECRVVKSALREIGQKNTPAISFELEITRDVLHDDQDVIGKKLFWDGFLSDAAFENTLKSLDKALGYTGNDLSDFNRGCVDGKELQAVVEEETNQGKVYNKVKFINAIGSVGGMKVDPAASQSIADRLKGKMLAYRQSNKPVPQATKPQTGQNPDLPF